MKDTDGTLVHTSRMTAPTSNDVVPGRMRTAIDAVTRPFADASAFCASAGTTAVGYHMLTTFDPGWGMVTGLVMTGIGALSTLATGWMAGENQICRPASMLRSDLAFLSGRNSVVNAAARMIASEWNGSRISVQSHGRYGYDSETRMMDILLPNGAEVTVLHRKDGRTLVTLDTKERGYQSFDPKRSLGMIGCAKIIETIESIQIERLCFLLGIPSQKSAVAVSRILAELLPSESKDLHVDDGGESAFLMNHVEDLHTIERRSIKATEITVFSIRPKYGTRHSELFVTAPGLGVLSLPTGPFSSVMKRRRSNTLHATFGSSTKDIVSVPVFLGNARATRLADLARQALREDPALTDSSGSSIRLLIDEHMPRLLAVHRDGASTASSSRIAEIDATLDRGLDVIAGALGDAIDAMNDRKFDALRTEVRFLESRHPEQGATALGLVA